MHLLRREAHVELPRHLGQGLGVGVRGYGSGVGLGVRGQGLSCLATVCSRSASSSELSRLSEVAAHRLGLGLGLGLGLWLGLGLGEPNLKP